MLCAPKVLKDTILGCCVVLAISLCATCQGVGPAGRVRIDGSPAPLPSVPAQAAGRRSGGGASAGTQISSVEYVRPFLLRGCIEVGAITPTCDYVIPSTQNVTITTTTKNMDLVGGSVDLKYMQVINYDTVVTLVLAREVLPGAPIGSFGCAARPPWP